MPRRIYDYAEELDVTAYNLISTIGAFILRRGGDGHQRDLQPAPRQARGQRPLAGQHAGVVHPVSTPPNNFDVIPRVRSVEPMKDIRRDVAAAARAAETVAQPAAPRSL